MGAGRALGGGGEGMLHGTKRGQQTQCVKSILQVIAGYGVSPPPTPIARKVSEEQRREGAFFGERGENREKGVVGR